MEGSFASSSCSDQLSRLSTQGSIGLPGFRKGKGVSAASPARKTPPLRDEADDGIGRVAREVMKLETGSSQLHGRPGLKGPPRRHEADGIIRPCPFLPLSFQRLLQLGDEPVKAKAVGDDFIPPAREAHRSPDVIPVSVAIDDRKGKVGYDLRHATHVCGPGEGIPDHHPFRSGQKGATNGKLLELGFNEPYPRPKRRDLRHDEPLLPQVRPSPSQLQGKDGPSG